MKTPVQKISLKPWLPLNKGSRWLGPTQLFLLVLFPVLLVLLMKRNGLSFREDMFRLFIFTTCMATWWSITDQKKSRHAQLRKPLLLESPPEKL